MFAVKVLTTDIAPLTSDVPPVYDEGSFAITAPAGFETEKANGPKFKISEGVFASSFKLPQGDSDIVDILTIGGFDYFTAVTDLTTAVPTTVAGQLLSVVNDPDWAANTNPTIDTIAKSSLDAMSGLASLTGVTGDITSVVLVKPADVGTVVIGFDLTTENKEKRMNTIKGRFMSALAGVLVSMAFFACADEASQEAPLQYDARGSVRRVARGRCLRWRVGGV